MFIDRTLTPAELTAIVKEPAQKVGLNIADNLVAVIVDDAITTGAEASRTWHVGTSSVLPLLEVALTRLWESDHVKGELTWETYNKEIDGKKVNGVGGALTQWADECFRSLGAEQPLARRVLTDLVYPGDPQQGISMARRRRTYAQVRGDAEIPVDETTKHRTSIDSDPLHRVVTKLADKHLIVTDQNDQKEITLELIDDELFRSWIVFEKDWLGPTYLPFLQWRAHIEPQLRKWIDSGQKGTRQRDRAHLLHGVELNLAQTWLEKRKEDIKPSESAFVQASIRRRDFRFWAMLISGAATLTLAVSISIIMGVLWSTAQDALEAKTEALNEKTTAFNEKTKALEVRNIALQESKQSEELAKQSEKRAKQSEKAARDSEEVAKQSEKSAKQSEKVARSRSAELTFNFGLSELRSNHWQSGLSQLIEAIQIAPEDDVARPSYRKIFFDWATGSDQKVGTPLRTGDRTMEIDFSPNGNRLATTTFLLNDVDVWDAFSTEPLPFTIPVGDAKLKGIGDVKRVRFTSDGRRIVTVGQDNKVRLWDASSGQNLGKSYSLPESYSSWRLSPTGDHLVVLAGNQMQLCGLNADERNLKSISLASPAKNMAFSSNGKWLVSLEENGSLRRWSTPAGENVGASVKAPVNIDQLAISDDGRALAATTKEQKVMLWVGSNADSPIVINAEADRIPTSPLPTLQFSPASDRLLSRAGLRTADIWRIDGSACYRLDPHDDAMDVVTFTPDAELIVGGTRSGKVYLWSAHDGKQLRQPLSTPENAIVFSLCPSPDSTRLAVGYGNTFSPKDGGAQLWFLIQGKPSGDPLVHPGKLKDAALVPGDRLLLTSGEDKCVRVWDLSSAESKRRDLLLTIPKSYV